MKAKRNGMFLLVYSFVALCLIEMSPALFHASASEYPDKGISVIICVPPGGNTDMGARMLTEAMQKELNQSVIVVNKPGAAGTIGGYALASAKPDGYTL